MEIVHMKRTLKIACILAGTVGILGLVSADPIHAQERKDTAVVYHPFGKTVTELTTTGLIRTASGDQLEELPAGDIRSRMTGQFPGLMTRELTGQYQGGTNHYTGVFPGDGWDFFLKGRTDLQLIVDDMRMPFNQLLLDPSLIESITLLPDVVDKARLGAIASNGAVYIKTRGGAYNTPMKVVATVESGIGMIDMLPEYVDGYQYARLNNQARAASGYTQLYDPVALEGAMKNDPHDLLAPNVDYKGLMLKSWRPIIQESVRITGGGSTVRYAAAISALHSNDILRTDQFLNYNRINLSGAMGAKLNKWMEFSVNYSSSVNFTRLAQVEWSDYNNVPAVAYPLDFGNALSDEEVEMGVFGATRWGVSKTYENNYYAKLKEGGFRSVRRRGAFISGALDTDLGFLLPGLKSKTGFSYISHFAMNAGKNDDYLAYYWDPTDENGYNTVSATHRNTKQASKSLLTSSTNMSLQFYERLYWDYAKNGHKLNVGATYLMYNAEGASITYRQRQMFGVADATYSYGDRYILEAVGQYVGSHMFDKAHRFAFMPSFGGAWVVSNEEFMKNVSFVDKLKLRAQWGKVGFSNAAFGTPYQYNSNYSFANSNYFGPWIAGDTWFGTNRWQTQASTINRFENSDLHWPTERMWNVGIDLELFKGFTLSADYSVTRRKDIITDVTSDIPDLYGIAGAITYDNYNTNDIQGWEITAGYHGQTGDFRYGLSLSASHFNTIYRVLVNNIFSESYQDKIGTHSTAIWGYQCLGRYQNAEQIASLPAYSTDLAVGDLYYKDVNGDGVVDTNDRTIIGDTNPLRYWVNLNLGWRRWNLQVIGAGYFGNDLELDNGYFWSGWGDGNYSKFVADNIGGAYPRLTYVKVNNNFLTSDFWITDGSYFKIKDVVLSYSFPKASIYLKGHNLLTLTKVKYVDPEWMNAGISSYPMFKTVTLGVKFTF